MGNTIYINIYMCIWFSRRLRSHCAREKHRKTRWKLTILMFCRSVWPRHTLTTRRPTCCERYAKKITLRRRTPFSARKTYRVVGHGFRLGGFSYVFQQTRVTTFYTAMKIPNFFFRLDAFYDCYVFNSKRLRGVYMFFFSENDNNL